MPYSAPHPCSITGCQNVVHHGAFCEKHKQIESLAYERARGSPTERGYDAAWIRYSIGYRRAWPFCKRCMKPSQCVDHIIPVTSARDPLFWDPSNHQALCNKCHSEKTRDDIKAGLTRIFNR